MFLLFSLNYNNSKMQEYNYIGMKNGCSNVTLMLNEVIRIYSKSKGILVAYYHRRGKGGTVVLKVYFPITFLSHELS